MKNERHNSLKKMNELADEAPFMRKCADEVMEDGVWNHIDKNKLEIKEIKRYASSPIKVDSLADLTVTQRFFVSVIKHNENTEGGWVDMRQETMCELYNIEERTLRNTIVKLKKNGLIDVSYYEGKTNKQYAKYKILDKALVSSNNKKHSLRSSATFMMRTSLTAEEKGFFLAIYEHMYERLNEETDNLEYRIGYSNRKLAEKTGLNRNTIAKYMYILQEKGFVEQLSDGAGYLIFYNKLQQMSKEEMNEQQLRLVKMIRDRDKEIAQLKK